MLKSFSNLERSILRTKLSESFPAKFLFLCLLVAIHKMAHDIYITNFHLQRRFYYNSKCRLTLKICHSVFSFSSVLCCPCVLFQCGKTIKKLLWIPKTSYLAFEKSRNIPVDKISRKLKAH